MRLFRYDLENIENIKTIFLEGIKEMNANGKARENLSPEKNRKEIKKLRLFYTLNLVPLLLAMLASIYYDVFWECIGIEFLYSLVCGIVFFVRGNALKNKVWLTPMIAFILTFLLGVSSFLPFGSMHKYLLYADSKRTLSVLRNESELNGSTPKTIGNINKTEELSSWESGK